MAKIYFTQMKEHFLNTPGAWVQLIVCVSIFLLLFIFSRLLRYKIWPWFIKKSESRNKKGLSVLLKGLLKPASTAVWLLGLYLTLFFLPLPAALSVILHSWIFWLARITLIAILAWGLVSASDVGPILMNRFKSNGDLSADNTVITFVNRLLKGIVIVFAALMILEELGAPVTSLITSLGIVGLTISLAAKDYATNFLGGIIIIFEKPFSIGDWIKTSAGEGAVVDISFRSTVIRSLDDSLVSIPNHLLIDNPVTNYSKIEKRLEQFTLGVTYDATRAQLEALMESIRSMLVQRKDVWADSVVVRLSGFGGSSIDILIQYNVKTGSKAEFLSIRESINLDLLGLVENAGCSFAFPSTSIYIEKK